MKSRYQVHWLPCDPPDLSKLAAFGRRESVWMYYVSMTIVGSLFAYDSRNNVWYKSMFSTTPGYEMPKPTITLPIPEGDVLPVEQWAWTREGKGAWSRSRCYVCGYSTSGHDHTQCNVSFHAARLNGTFP